MSLPTRNLRHALKSIVPNWLADIPGLNVGFSILFIVALCADILIDVLMQGVFAAWPGKGDPSALSLIGRGRGLIRGREEGADEYALRLLDWLALWPESGSAETLGRLVQGYLGGSLVVRVIDRRGNFTTVNADGSVDQDIDATWNFDETGYPIRAINPPTQPGWWSDVWVVVYLDTRWPTYTDLTDADFIANWGTYDAGGTGHEVPRGIRDDLNSIFAVFKGAHNWVECVVFTTDTALFVPGALGATYPDGEWGRFSKYSAGKQIPARATTSAGGTIRYWVPAGGG